MNKLIKAGTVVITYIDGSDRIIDLAIESKALEISGGQIKVFGMLAGCMPVECFKPGAGSVVSAEYRA